MSDADTSTGAETARATPPRAPMVYRVGVVGHRPDRLKHASSSGLATVIGTILETVKSEVAKAHGECGGCYDPAPFTLRAITPLAEGVDRIFGEKALALGYEIVCVMPFDQQEFEKDFQHPHALEEGSLERFHRLLDRARRETVLTKFEMDGCRSDEGTAYGAAGRVVLNQSDLLMVVWDGYRLGKRGGTEEAFDEAKRRGITTIWIDAHSPHKWQIIDAASPAPNATTDPRSAPGGGGSEQLLRAWVRETLDIPRKAINLRGREDDPAYDLEQFYKERQPGISLAFVWKIFRDIFADYRIRPIPFAVVPFESSTTGEWPRDRSTAIARVTDTLRPFYAWCDKLAILYSDRYRSAFIAVFVLAALAVGLALMPVGLDMEQHHAPELICIASEVIVILVIIFLVMIGRSRRWHERWIDYRLAAELVRHVRLVAPLGGARPFPQVPAHWTTYGQPATTWMAWYVRALERALGLPDARVDKKYLAEYLDNLARIVDGGDGQILYHEVTHRRCHAIEKNLHVAGFVLLVATILACFFHLFPYSAPISHVLTFLCGFFPALGAAMQGIVHQGEFRRIAKHSESMKLHLEGVLKQIEKLREEIQHAPLPYTVQYSTRASALASDTARLLMSEVLDWRVVFLDQPLEPPA